MALAETNIIFSALIFVTIMLLFMMLRQKHKYWSYQGISYLKPMPVFGNIFRTLLMKVSFGELYKEVYLKFPKDKVVGIYEFYEPVLLVKDPELVDNILVKDFQYFVDHPMIGESNGLFAYGLFQLKGMFWRAVRYKISPAFTSGKLKRMHDTFETFSEDIIKDIDGNLNRDYAIEHSIKRYIFGILATTVFGIQATNEKAREDFIKECTLIFNTSSLEFLQIFSLAHFPKISNWLGFKFINNNVQKFFRKVIADTLKNREGSKDQHYDYTQQLVKLKQQKVLQVDLMNDEEKTDEQMKTFEISEELLSGQAFQFLNAGFDPPLFTIIKTMYEMCRYPGVQERARVHVKEVLQKHNNQYTYACIKEMTYLDQCLLETLRLHPILLFIFRQCTKDYFIPEVELKIKKGQKVVIPSIALQTDPKYYPNPDVYDPDRFPPNSPKSSSTYLPFGDGPRMCIGIRFSFIIMKLAMAKILANYKFTLSAKTKLPLEHNKLSFVYLPTTKIYFNFESL